MVDGSAFSDPLWFDIVCEAFPGRLPTEIHAEVQRLPVGFLDELLECRAYRRAFYARESAEQSGNAAEAIKRLPRGGMYALVPVIDMELAEAQTKGGDGG